ncbi:hypothetical protein AO269_26080 [Pseudomonas putida]|nr:hypothetical protein AO269_26080 [Pseudomonas putida]
MSTPVSNDYVYALDREFVFHSWSTQGALNPLVIAGGQGCTMWDYEGRQYLDFSSQLVNTNIGHQHPKVIAAIVEQAGSLVTVAPATANLMRGEAAKRILARAPSHLLFTGRDKILSAYRSYHGSTGAAIVATGDPRRVPNEFARGHVHFFNPYLFRTEFHATNEQEECERALQHLRRVIECEGPAAVAAILLESVPGTAGILVPPKGYLAGVRALADEYGILVILDEVMAGFGRTGSWLALDHFDIVPDLICFAKGVNSGYVPAGGVMISKPIAEYFDDHFFPGGLTYSGHPLAMAAIVATLDVMAEEGIVDNARQIGHEVLGPGLRALAAKYPLIGEARGIGLFWALEFISDKTLKTPLAAPVMGQMKAAFQARGLLTFIVENRLHVVPPCIVNAAQVEEALGIFDEVIGEFSGRYSR